MMRHSILLAAALAALPTLAAAGMTVPEPQTRVIASGGLGADGLYRAGIEIRLPDGWHTYWRNPGDSGIPPTISTDGSVNLKDLRTFYPAPERYFDGYGTSIVYMDRVLLPIEIAPEDPARAVAARIALDFGYCREICVPARAEFTLDLAPEASADAPAAAAIDAARARVPRPEADAGPDAPRIVSLEPRGGEAVAITVEGPDGVDLFAEGPEGWYLSPPERGEAADGRTVFLLSLDGRPKGAATTGVPLVLTVSAGANSIEARRVLD